MFVIRSTDLRKALDHSPHSVWRWLGSVENEQTWSFDGGANGRAKGRAAGSTPNAFRLSDVVVALSRQGGRSSGLKGEQLRALVDLAGTTFDPSQPLGDDAVGRGQALRAVLSPGELEQADRCANSYLKGTTLAFWDRFAYGPVDIATCVVLVPGILRYALTGDRDGTPETADSWADLASKLILSRSDPDTIAKLAGSVQ